MIVGRFGRDCSVFVDMFLVGLSFLHLLLEEASHRNSEQQIRRAFAQGVSDHEQCAFDVYLFMYLERDFTKNCNGSNMKQWFRNILQ